MSKSNKIRHIVRIHQMLKQWRRKARSSASSSPSDVPAGHVAVYVGASCRRFVVRATFLNHPIFKRILAMAEEEYGFENSGPLRIPCDEWEFEEVLKLASRSEQSSMFERSRRLAKLEDVRRCAFYGGGGGCVVDKAAIGEVRPLLS
ncbi:Auxin-responsive protein SAUR71 [Linum perenne]